MREPRGHVQVKMHCLRLFCRFRGHSQQSPEKAWVEAAKQRASEQLRSGNRDQGPGIGSQTGGSLVLLLSLFQFTSLHALSHEQLIEPTKSIQPTFLIPAPRSLFPRDLWSSLLPCLDRMTFFGRTPATNSVDIFQHICY